MNPLFTTPAGAPPWKRLALYSPLARILIFLVLTGVPLVLMRMGFAAVGWGGKDAPDPQRHIAMFLVQVLPVLCGYLFLVRVVERRRVVELRGRLALPDTALGFVGGVVLISAVVAVLWLLGSYHVTATDGTPRWLVQLLVGGMGAAISEEIIARGIIFRITEEGLGTWGALVISALVFGFGHMGNQGASVWSSVAITVEAGLLFGLLFHVTRSLPLCMGLHMGWNFTQGTLWGIPVSGGKDTGWLVSTRTGPEWLSGGAFGAEASVVAVAMCSAVTLALLARALRNRSIVPPWFARRAPAPPPAADNELAKA